MAGSATAETGRRAPVPNGSPTDRQVLAQIDAAIETGRLGARARNKREVSERLRSSALELFFERGYADVTVSDIADRAGLTSRTFFRHFPTKETVIVDIIDQTNTRLVEQLAANHRDEPIMALLERVLIAWFEEFAEIFSLIRRMSASAESLLAALELRQAYWERHISEAIGHRYPDRSRIACDIWAAVFFALMRLADEARHRTSAPYAESVPQVFAAYRAEMAGL